MQRIDVRGTQFSIVGGARSGIAVAKLLRRHGAEVFLSDKAPVESMQNAVQELDRCGVRFEFGGNTPRILESDIVVVSPGVPSDSAVVKDALAQRLKVVSELEVASWFCRAPVVGITGTNGKTTTTALTGRIFEDARRSVAVAGNIGLAFSEVVDQLGSESIAVVEVSSFQLDHVESFRPKVAVWLNVTPDHLDRYDHSYEKYVAAKCRIFANQREGDVIVYNHDDPLVRTSVETLAHPSVSRAPFSTSDLLEEGAYVNDGCLTLGVAGQPTAVLDTDQLSIRGQHNLYNAMAASLAAKAMGVSTASVRATLRNFKGVEHRLEFVREIRGVTYVNDSKATNVDSVWYALQSFSSPIILLLGGRDKGNDYARLIDLVRNHVKAIVAIGESADRVIQAFSGTTAVVRASSMPEAVQRAASLSASGEIVLLSPACASFDWFDNYEHRGRVFKELVNAL